MDQDDISLAFPGSDPPLVPKPVNRSLTSKRYAQGVGPVHLSFGGSLLTVQVAAALLAPVALALAPPASGAMLLIPVGRTDAVVFAREHGALLLAPGALPGSIVVTGDRTRLLADPLRSGILVVAAMPSGCGPVAERTI